MELMPTACSLQALVEDALDMTYSFSRHADVELITCVEAHPLLPDVIFVDEQRVRQILMNYIGNALSQFKTIAQQWAGWRRGRGSRFPLHLLMITRPTFSL